jgi:soluble lytic murein transglycosylase-like protein
MKRFGVALGLAVALMGNGAAAQGGYEDAITSACATYRCDPTQLIRVMYCESEGNPAAWSPNPNGGSDVGLFQINDATWGDIAYAGPYEQIDWAAQMFAAGLGYHWLCQ